MQIASLFFMGFYSVQSFTFQRKQGIILCTAVSGAVKKDSSIGRADFDKEEEIFNEGNTYLKREH